MQKNIFLFNKVKCKIFHLFLQILDQIHLQYTFIQQKHKKKMNNKIISYATVLRVYVDQDKI